MNNEYILAKLHFSDISKIKANVLKSVGLLNLFMPGQTTEIKESKVARNTKELVTLLWPELL